MLEAEISPSDFTHSDAISKIFPCKPLLSSHKLGWNGIHVQHHLQPAWETPDSCSLHHVIVLHHAEQTTKIERVMDGHHQTEQVIKGNIAIVPAHAQSRTNWNREGYFTLLFIEPISVAQIAYESVDVDRIKIVPQFATPDPLIYQIGLSLKSELESNGICSRLYIDSLFTALAVNVIRRYSTHEQAIPNYAGGLPKNKLRQAMDYINDHLALDVSLKAIADELKMSPYYFTSLFKQSTGLSAHQYVIRCRVKKAQQLLSQENLSIVEVCQEVGFESQSHFIKVFRKYVGMTPKTYRQVLLT